MSKTFRLISCALFAAFGWGLSATGADAQCSVLLRNIDNIRFTGANAYRVFEPVDGELSASFDVRHRRGEACEYFVAFSTGQSGSYDRQMEGEGVLSYLLYDSPARTNVLKDLPQATSSEVITGAFSTTAPETNSHSYIAVVPQYQVVAAGLYTDQVDLVLYEGTLTGFAERDRRTVNLRARVLADVQACFGNCGGGFDPGATSGNIDFGILEEGVARTADVWIRSNSNYSVRLQSENRGVLRHESSYDSEVPYMLLLNGTPVDVTRVSVRFEDGVGPTSVTGVPYTLHFEIGTTASAAAGLHRDRVTLTFRTLR